MQSNKGTWITVVSLMVAVSASVWPATVHAQVVTDRATAAASGELEARRLLERGQELLDAGEQDRGIKMIETVIDQFPGTRTVFPACLALGRHYIKASEHLRAIGYLNRLRVLEPEEKLAEDEDRDWFLEAMYLIGTGYFNTRQFTRAFPVLRHITMKYPNTVWANQAYYYIGLCHFAQENWSKAIEALSLVGTFVDPDSPTTAFCEAGRRFYVKVNDADFPIMLRMGKKISVTIETDTGDKEELECVPLTPDAQILITSLPTAIGVPNPGDRLLQVVGGQEVTATFVDESTQDGSAEVIRTSVVKMVSSGGIDFMLGDFEARAPAAFLAQPLFIQLVDVDLDTSDAAEQVTLSVISRYKARTDDGEEEQNAFADKVAMRYQLRDRVDVTLIEQPNDANAGGPIRSGRFTGKVSVVLAHETQPADQADMELACLVEDEVYVTYTDNLHVYGDTPRTLDAMVTVAGEINNRPVASQDVVFDPVMRARKNLVEASAYLELARIFKSMGLMAGTIERAAEGVARVESVIRTDNRDVGAALKQDAFKTKWELHIEAGQLSEALATCAIFNQYYPDSPLVADALLGVGKINLEDKKYKDAVAVFEQITRLSSASMDIRAEAQFEIAKTLEIIFQESLAKMDAWRVPMRSRRATAPPFRLTWRARNGMRKARLPAIHWPR